VKFLPVLFALLAVPALAADGLVDASQAPFLWQVQGPKALHTLMGSVHLLPASAHPLPASLERAYTASRALLLETDLNALSDPELQTRMLAAARDDRAGGLKARIGAPLYAKLQKRAEKLGMPLPACADLRGWFCALTLELFPLQQAEFTSEYGLDQYFYARALEDGRPIAGLESAAQQTELFTGITDALSTQMIRESLDDKAYASQTPAELLRLWRTGDVAALEKLMKDMKKQYPQLYERLLAARNRAWIPVLVQQLNGEAPTLVIVGAGHVVGPDGLLALLRTKGFEVKPAPAVPEVAAPPKT
jgi:uncharacterized protein YbaP (TraB family)